MKLEFQISPQIRAWGKANDYDVELHYELFLDYLANRRQKPYKDLDAAYRQCVRCDWGNLRRNKQLMQPKTYTKPAEYVHQVKGKKWVPASSSCDGYWAAAE